MALVFHRSLNPRIVYMQIEDRAEKLTDNSILWNQYLAGDNDAFALIYNQNVRTLFRYGLIFCSDKELIKDCIHDVFIKIDSNRSNLQHINNISSYLCTALRNAIINAMKRMRNQAESIDILDNMSEDDDSPESYLIEREDELLKNATIDNIMSILTVRQREIIYYRFIQDMSIDEISLITNMNNQSVSNVIQRSLIRIRKIFKKK